MSTQKDENYKEAMDNFRLGDSAGDESNFWLSACVTAIIGAVLSVLLLILSGCDAPPSAEPVEQKESILVVENGLTGVIKDELPEIERVAPEYPPIPDFILPLPPREVIINNSDPTQVIIIYDDGKQQAYELRREN